jgi:hypothetical protein
LLLTGIGMESALLALLVWKRIFRTLPVFTLYIGWSLCIDIAGGMVLRFLPERYFRFYLIELIIDALFQFGILAELARSVRRHNRASSPIRTVFTPLLLLAVTLIWLMATWTAPVNSTIMGKLLVHLQQTFAILRVAFVLALVWWSSLQGLRWPDRELRIVTGVGFYSIVALAVSILHTHQAFGPLYQWLDEVVAVSYLTALAYWILSFAARESKPRASLSSYG